MNLISSLLNRFRRKRLSPVEPHFIGIDQLFQMQFDERWIHSRGGNSFYYFFNEADNLKGGFQLSLIWNQPIAQQITSMEALKQKVVQRERIEPIQTAVGEYQAFYIGVNYTNNNMDHHIWYVYIEQVQVRIHYSIFEEEPIEIKKQWFERVARIIDTLTINQAQLLQTTFRS